MPLRAGIGFMLGFLLLASPLAAQYGPNEQRRDATAPLSELEAELQQMSRTVLQHRSTRHKDSVNQLLMRRLEIILKRTDSYDHGFPLLGSISRLSPKDNSFRIFTWTAYHFDTLIRQTGPERFDTVALPRETKYFGCIQRRLPAEKGAYRIKLHFLQDVVEPHERLTNEIGSPENWFGSLYYHPRNSEYGVLTFRGYVRKQHGLTGRSVRQKINYYVVLGLNQHDGEVNYKTIDVITFDPQDSNFVAFGAPIFHIKNGVPQKRVTFEYSDNSPFSLNLAYVLSQRTTRRGKQLMIVFDHIDRQGNSPQERRLGAGADGTTDALYFFRSKWIDQRKGLFYFLRNVAVYEPGIEKFKPSEVRRQKRDDLRRRRKSSVPFKSTPRPR